MKMKTLFIKNYILPKGFVSLEAEANAQLQENVLQEAFSILRGEHKEDLLQFLEKEVNSQMGVPNGTLKVHPQIELEIYDIELEMCGKKIQLSSNDSMEDVLRRWDKLMSR